MITVKFTSKLRVDLGRENDRVEANSVAEAVSELERRYGDVFKSWIPHCRVFVNGMSAANLDGPDTTLADGDEVLFLLPVAGG
jgi:molybdopterin converting factor small subunit